MRLLKVLFISILILLPFGELLRFNIGSNIYLKPLDILVGITSFTWFIIYIFQKKKKSKYFPGYIFLFPLIGLLSLLLHTPLLQGNELFVASLYLLRWIAYISIIFVVAQFNNKIKQTIVKALFGVGLVFVLVGFLQYFFYHDIRHLIYIGWDDHMYRMFSTFFDPNFAGAFFVLFFLFVAGIFFDKKKKFTAIQKKLLSALLGIVLLAIFLTFSRSALLMLIISSSVFLFMINMKRLLFLLIGIISIFIIVISPFFYLENINLLRTASSEARIETAHDALVIIKDHPLLGVGFNSYRYVQQNYGLRNEQPKYPSNADAGVDNSWLFVLATTGIVGFCAYLYLWYRLLRNAYAQYQKNILATVFISSSLGLFINAFFINSLFFAPIMLWMWILYGLLIKEE